MKIIIGSQTWAWGPASKAEVIGNLLTSQYHFEVDFYGDSVSYEFCDRSKSFSKCICIEDETDFSCVDFSSYDLVISVMNPYLAVHAYKSGKKVFWLDSMSWIWNWSAYSKIEKLYNQIIHRPISDIIAELKSLPPYDCKIFGHICSEWMFIQGNYYHKDHVIKKSEYVSAIINTKHVAATERDTIMISLSGQLCPYMDIEKGVTYGNKVQFWLEEILDYYKGSRILFVGNDKVIEHIDKRDGIIYQQLPHNDFLKELNRCKALFCPCGFTTVYEGAAYSVPMFFLPETHDGNAYEFLLITRGASNEERESAFPNLLLDVYRKNIYDIEPAEVTMDALYNCYHKLETNKEFLAAYKDKARSFIARIEEDRQLASRQLEIINRTINVDNGISYIIERILSML